MPKAAELKLSGLFLQRTIDDQDRTVSSSDPYDHLLFPASPENTPSRVFPYPSMSVYFPQAQGAADRAPLIGKGPSWSIG